MADLDNKSFTVDPWRVSLAAGVPDDEGWRACRLTLVRVAAEPLVDVAVNLYRDEFPSLVRSLAELADGAIERLDFEPLEPSFILRARRWSDDDVELAWFVDQGELDARVSTQSGVGVLVRVAPDRLRAFADALATEAPA